MQNNSLTLNHLTKGQYARITGFLANEADLTTRLREIGFAEGDLVKILHFGLFGKNPISVLLNGSTIALRRQTARAILVEALDQ